MPRVAAVAAFAFTVTVLGACGGENSANRDDRPKAPSAPSERDDEGDDAIDPVAHGSRDPKRFPAEAADSFAKAARTASAKGSRLEQAQDKLPIRQPPLPIQQYVFTDKSHRVVARLDPPDYFCIGDTTARRAAIEAYFTEAREAFSTHDIGDLTLIVALTSENIDHFKVLARADQAGVKLTKR